MLHAILNFLFFIFLPEFYRVGVPVSGTCFSTPCFLNAYDSRWKGKFRFDSLWLNKFIVDREVVLNCEDAMA